MIKTRDKKLYLAKFADMADSLVSAVASSAGLERHFSTMGMNYGTLRSRLGVEKARKLCFLYKQLNKCCCKDWEETFFGKFFFQKLQFTKKKQI